uniref:Metalloendopeptidase n=1 Tax=Strongyloides stercoralis TaxID=6248 RepID=A0A0K0E579_STRER
MEHSNKVLEGLISKEEYSCSSFVKRQEKQPQGIYLTSECYGNPYSILHELEHALGLVHEHARIGRDNFIDIDFGQLEESSKKNFRIYNSSYFVNYSTSYDYASLMHYDQYAFGSWWYWFIGRPVIRPKLHVQYSRMMGQRKVKNFNDFKKINLLYCNWCGSVDNKTNKLNSTVKPKCRNGGYLDFNNCSKCICPTGYTGDLCRQTIPSDIECGNTTFVVNTTGIQLIFNDRKNCYISLKATNKKKSILI